MNTSWPAGVRMEAAGRAAPREPARVWLAVVAATVLLVLRKSWALGTPQLWAEDGSVHLTQNDQFGAGAFFLPYRGYLHLLPRVIAWVASRLADIIYWPAIYNVAAFMIAIALLARLASRRIDVPGKPWLVLSFVLVAHTGEVWFNITNLHWLTAFFLVLQTLIARPTTASQRFFDLAIVAVAGLTGPFVIVFLPLFAWRWWRERHGDNLAALLIAAACAAIQVYFLRTTSTPLPPQARPLNLELLLAVTGSRLVVWPFFGERAAQALSWPALGAIGVTFIVALLGWALRPDPRRPLRAQIVAAFVLIAGVCLWRIRPDTWAYPDLVNGDSYFYIARVLLVWLVIWEFDAQPHLVALAARVLCGLALLLELPSFRLPALPDYRWEMHCDAIRHGEPAEIPTLPVGYVFRYPGRPAGGSLPDRWLKPAASRNPGRFVNLSILTRVTEAEPSFTVGLVIGGVGTGGVKPLVVRAVGPSLAAVGLDDGLPDPAIAIMSGTAEVAANDDWAGGGADRLSAAFGRVRAFLLRSPESRDAAVFFSPNVVSPASFTIPVRGKGGVGRVLVEAYDATLAGTLKRTTPRLINFSALKHVVADDLLTTGFVIGGASSRRMLVRAVGATLGTEFGIEGAMPDPKIEIFDGSGKLVAANNDWGGGEKLAATFRHVAAFQLPADSKDAAVVISLPPGSYSAQVTGAAGAAGKMLVEIYEVP